MSELPAEVALRAGMISDEAARRSRKVCAVRIAQRSSDDYEQARSIWNAMIDRRPARRALAGAADVVRAVRLLHATWSFCWQCAVRRTQHRRNAVSIGPSIDLSLDESVRVTGGAHCAV